MRKRAVVGETSISGITKVSCYREALRVGVVGIEELDGFVAGTGKKFLVVRPGHPFDDAFVGLDIPDLLTASKVPDFHNAVAAAACKPLEGLRIFGHGVNTIDVTFA